MVEHQAMKYYSIAQRNELSNELYFHGDENKRMSSEYYSVKKKLVSKGFKMHDCQYMSFLEKANLQCIEKMRCC